MNEYLAILKHDLHKIKVPGYVPHSQALTDIKMKKADGIAARLSRNWMKCEIEQLYPFRRSYITFDNDTTSNSEKQSLKRKIEIIFDETDPKKLHSLILKTNLLNFYSESLDFPFTSLKYHILLTCAIYYNLVNGHQWSKLIRESSQILGISNNL